MLRKSHCTQCTHNILTHTRTGHKMCNFQRTIQKFANQNKIRTFFRTQHNTRREKEKHIVEYETANRMEMCIIKWKEQCQLCVFFWCFVAIAVVAELGFFLLQKIIFGSFSICGSLSCFVHTLLSWLLLVLSKVSCYFICLTIVF